jgi:hypothetical protein
MKIFSILKVDDEYSLKQYPLVGLRLDSLSVSPKQSGASTTPTDGVSVILIATQIFLDSILNDLCAAKTLHHFSAITVNIQTV